jgi:hypothetical protein
MPAAQPAEDRHLADALIQRGHLTTTSSQKQVTA